ncbi:SagB/ThcOx family dehydrogenase [Thermodesulfobacteriota bacterium]
MHCTSAIRITTCMICLVFLTISAVGAEKAFDLPKPSYDGKVSVEAAMVRKNSVRSFKKKPLSLAEVSQMLWAANGRLPPDAISGATRKVIPSAGGLYPLEVFLLAGKDTVENLAAGVYQYRPTTHTLKMVEEGDKRKKLASAAHGQMWLAGAPATIVIGGVFSRMTVKYRDRGVNYVLMEAGNSNQNLFLQAESLGLQMGTIGAFRDERVSAAIKLPSNVNPLLLVPFGH